MACYCTETHLVFIMWQKGQTKLFLYWTTVKLCYYSWYQIELLSGIVSWIKVESRVFIASKNVGSISFKILRWFWHSFCWSSKKLTWKPVKLQYSQCLWIKVIAQKVPEMVTEYWNMRFHQWLETEVSAFQSCIFICKSISYHEVKHFMAGTHELGMSIHTVYPFSTAQLACFHFTPESTMSIFIHIFFPLCPVTHSQSDNFSMVKFYLPREKESLCSELLQYPGVPGVSFQTCETVWVKMKFHFKKQNKIRQCYTGKCEITSVESWYV